MPYSPERYSLERDKRQRAEQAGLPVYHLWDFSAVHLSIHATRERTVANLTLNVSRENPPPEFFCVVGLLPENKPLTFRRVQDNLYDPLGLEAICIDFISDYYTTEPQIGVGTRKT